MLIGLMFSYIAILLRIILRWVSFVGDVLLVMVYCLAILPVVVPGRDPSVFARDLLNIETLSFRIPLAVSVLYLLLDFIIYKLLYQGVTTYGRYMYAVRTFVLMLLPVSFVAAVIATTAQGYAIPFAQTFGEWLGLILGTSVLIVTAWAFFGIAEFLIESVALLNMAGSKLTVRQTFMTPRRVFQILFRRQPEFEKPHAQSKQPLYRRLSPLRQTIRKS